MGEYRRASCRSCGAGIFWARTESGKAVPIDYEPIAEGGNVRVLSDVGASDGPMVRVGIPAPGYYRSHFATCPDAAQHRKSKAKP